MSSCYGVCRRVSSMVLIGVGVAVVRLVANGAALEDWFAAACKRPSSIIGDNLILLKICALYCKPGKPTVYIVFIGRTYFNMYSKLHTVRTTCCYALSFSFIIKYIHYK